MRLAGDLEHADPHTQAESFLLTYIAGKAAIQVEAIVLVKHLERPRVRRIAA